MHSPQSAYPIWLHPHSSPDRGQLENRTHVASPLLQLAQEASVAAASTARAAADALAAVAAAEAAEAAAWQPKLAEALAALGAAGDADALAAAERLQRSACCRTSGVLNWGLPSCWS